jgi:hypothetical protein
LLEQRRALLAERIAEWEQLSGELEASGAAVG